MFLWVKEFISLLINVINLMIITTTIIIIFFFFFFFLTKFGCLCQGQACVTREAARAKGVRVFVRSVMACAFVLFKPAQACLCMPSACNNNSIPTALPIYRLTNLWYPYESLSRPPQKCFQSGFCAATSLKVGFLFTTFLGCNSAF